jgi:hypothetical protein
MECDHPRWRVRIGTLMLLVVIAALAAALFVEHTKRLAAERRAAAEAGLARAQAEEATARVQFDRARAERAQILVREALEEAKAAGRRGE